MKTRRTWTQEEKEHVVEKIETLKRGGATRKEVQSALLEMGVAHDAMFYKWRRELAQQGAKELRQIKPVNMNGDKILKARCERLEQIVIELLLDKKALMEYAGR